MCKRFAGRRVLNDLSFDVQPGEIVGICGPNGSGKSTLLRILCGLLRPTRGSVVYSPDLSPADARRYIGYVSPLLSLYEDLSAVENLRFFCSWRGITSDTEAILERVGLDPRRRDPLRTYSSGMRQRVKLAWALLHDPPILMLDEPGSNLDDDGRAIVASIVREGQARGWVILAGNDPEELALCTRKVSLA